MNKVVLLLLIAMIAVQINARPGDAKKDAKDAASKAKDAADKGKDAADKAKDTAKDAGDKAADAAKGAADKAKGAGKSGGGLIDGFMHLGTDLVQDTEGIFKSAFSLFL